MVLACLGGRVPYSFILFCPRSEKVGLNKMNRARVF
jgi:hypothetical protein